MVYGHDAVAHAGDQIHEVIPSPRLGQPDRVEHIAFESDLFQMADGLGHVLRGKKQVQIFCRPPDASMLLQRECTCDGVRDFVCVHNTQHFTKKFYLLHSKGGRLRRAYGQRFWIVPIHVSLDGRA